MQQYTCKQIIFALRDEYLKNQKRLEALKGHIHLTTEKELEEFNFYVIEDDVNKYAELAIKQRQSMLVKIIESISSKIISDAGKKDIEIAHELNGERRYLTLPESQLYEVTDMNQLMADTDKILGNDFTQNISTGLITFQDENYSFRLTPSNILIETGYHKANYSPSRIVYSPVTDSISIMSYDEPLYLDQIGNIFNFQIPEDKLNDYHKEVIENSDKKEPELSIYGLTGSRLPQVYKVEERNASDYLLKRSLKG